MSLIQKTADKIINHYKTSAIILGLLLALALPPLYFYFGAVVAFSGLIWLIGKMKNYKQVCALGYMFGAGYFGAGLYWIANAVLVDVAHLGWLYPLIIITNALFFGLFVIVPVVLAKTKFAYNIWAKIAVFSVSWVIVVEWFRGFFLTGFPWNPVSSILAFSPIMLQSLAWWGTYGLSLIVIFICCIPAIFLINPHKKNMIIAICGVLIPLCLLGGYGWYTIKNVDSENTTENISVRLVQPSIPQTMKWNKKIADENLQKYIDLSKNADNSKIDFVIWGETASPYDLTFERKYSKKVSVAVPEKGYLITGMLRYEISADGYVPYNSLAVMNENGQVLDTYDKSHLVPFGEYIPLRKYLPKWVRPVASVVSEFGQGQKYQTIMVDNFAEFAPLICYEIIFSDEVVRKENKPKWMVLLTNDGWYGVSSGPYQHLVSAQMRAVEEGMNIVRSANSGISAIISPYGQILQRLELNENGFVDGIVPISLAHYTLFGEYGNKIPLTMCWLILLMVGICYAYHKKYQRSL